MLDEFYDEDLTRSQKLLVLGGSTVVQPYMQREACKLGLAEPLARYMTMPVYVAVSQLNRDMDLVEWYYWRGSAMDFFIEAPARLLKLDEATVRTLIEAGRWLRGIILVWKDLKDIDHDRETGAENPFLEGEVDVQELVGKLQHRLGEALERLGDEERRRFQEVVAYYLNGIEVGRGGE